MSNSSLIVYTKLSPNCTRPRSKPIDTITIHCMAGNCSIETCGEIFSPPGAGCSSNYGIGSDGRIALYVEECNRSWCSSSGANDHRAVTIEVANISGAPEWRVSDQAMAALLDLCTDLCKRNGIRQLVWREDRNNPGNMTVHRWFANKSCPGEYLYTRQGEIAAAVNQRLDAPSIPPTPPPIPFEPYTVRVILDRLYIRKGPSTGYALVGEITDRGVYTLVQVQSGWGKLKSGAGWISLSGTRPNI